MSGVLAALEPKEVFQYFEEICSIPHGSTNTKEISDYCVKFAKNHKLKYVQDVDGNVIIWKPGTPGYENAETIMIQGHLDMVCEKEADYDIDFEKDGLELQLQDGIISAKGTTLGGDDGIAVAYALAILEASDIPHPPLEVVFTIDEEIGLLGAASIDCSELKSKKMLNIDSEEEGYLLVSCAGGVTSTCYLPVERQSKAGVTMEFTISGLNGGHSGVEIDKGRANACQLLGRSLYMLKKKTSFNVIAVNGGLKDNAIPREASAIILFDENTDMSVLEKEVVKLEEIYKKEFVSVDPDVSIALTEKTDVNEMPMTEEMTNKVITALLNLPGGIQRMSADVEGLVQTSLNLGILETREKEVVFSFSVRSSVGTEKEEVVNRMTCLMESLGGKVECKGDYPAWEYRKDSPLRDLMVRVYEEKYGKKPVIQAIHAGLECGFFSGKISDLDCVSFGPDMKDIHTPNERMDAASVKRTWEYILEILKESK